MLEGNSDRRVKTAGYYTIYQLIRDWAKATPEAIAIASPSHEPITYRQLVSHVDSIVKSLNEIGISRKDRIAIVLPNSCEMAITFLGVSCTAISVPLNPSNRENEIDVFLSDIPAKALIAQSGVDLAAVSAAQRRSIPVIEVVSARKAGPSVFIPKASAPVPSARYRQPEPDDVALVLHTSGTTSKPKRVPLTHRNLCASASSIRETLKLTSSDRCLGVMPLFHIHGLIGGLLSSLAAGASFAATPDFDGNCFFDWMKELSPTWYTAVPTIHQEILRCAREHIEIIETGRLRFIRSSSAPLPRKVSAQLEEVFKVPVIEAYGMTEAAHQITSNPLPPGERKAGSVGTATHTEVAIMDEAGNVLAAGERGEIVLRGASVMSGYEPQTGNKDSLANGWLRTGDLGYFDSDGYLFLTGRLRETINRGGEKISPCEIDQALLDHPDILQAVTFATSHPSLGEEIAAAVVVRDRTQTTEASIREYLIHRLAAFKLPSQLLIVNDIPKSPTGKVQRADLAKTFSERLPDNFVAPKNPLEASVARIFADVLELKQVSARDNFFALGGDSLRATQVLSRVRSLFSINLPIATLFLKTTVAELAEKITASAEALDHNLEKAIITESKVVSEEGTPSQHSAEVSLLK